MVEIIHFIEIINEFDRIFDCCTSNKKLLKYCMAPVEEQIDAQLLRHFISFANGLATY